MTMNRRVVALGVAVWLWGGVGAVCAQPQPSLAEAARQATEARKAKEKPSKVYTNEDVKTGRALTVTRPAGERPAAAADPAPADPKAAAPDPALKRAQELKAYVADREAETERLQRRLTELNEAVLASFSEEQRQALVRDRDAAIADIRKLQIDIEAQRKAAADLEAGAARQAPPKPQ